MEGILAINRRKQDSNATRLEQSAKFFPLLLSRVYINSICDQTIQMYPPPIKYIVH